MWYVTAASLFLINIKFSCTDSLIVLEFDYIFSFFNLVISLNWENFTKPIIVMPVWSNVIN